MKPGSVIIDMAAEAGGNVELTWFIIYKKIFICFVLVKDKFMFIRKQELLLLDFVILKKVLSIKLLKYFLFIFARYLVKLFNNILWVFYDFFSINFLGNN